MSQQPPAPEPTRVAAVSEETMRPEILGTRAVLAAKLLDAVAAGLQMVERGGNAVDAGVASVFAAAVVEISHFGFGGEAPTMIYDPKTKRVVVINGQGPAPRAATPALFAAKGKVDGNGPLAATVPAVVDAMALALEHFGTMRLAEVMAPAIALADGFPMYAFLRDFLVRERAASEQWDWTARTYYPGGRIPDVGEVFRQPNLAATMRAIVAAEGAAIAAGRGRAEAIRAGRDAFYKGDIARRMAEATQAAGGVLSVEDLAAFEGRLEEPATTSFHGYDVYKAGAWNQGPVLLQTLNLLEGFDLRAMGHNSADYIHTVHEAIKLAYADRNAYYGDPDFAAVPLTGLLSKAYAAERRALIGPRASLEHRVGDPYPHDPLTPPARRYVPAAQGVASGQEPGDTTGVSVVDASGMLFSSTPSSGWLLGGAFIAGDTGVPMSNRMQVFDLDPLSPNALVGGKRPRTTLTPTIVLEDGVPLLSINTPGGDSQDQQILNVLLNVMVFDLPLQVAVERARVNSLHPFSSFDDHRSEPGVLEVEDRVPVEVRDALAARGHVLRVLGPYGMSTGITAVGVSPGTGTLRGAADPRRERYVMGW
ncbi:MAG: gamma-glutamyltransferase family protein [Vicinamibacteria bacterium]